MQKNLQQIQMKEKFFAIKDLFGAIIVFFFLIYLQILYIITGKD